MKEFILPGIPPLVMGALTMSISNYPFVQVLMMIVGASLIAVGLWKGKKGKR